MNMKSGWVGTSAAQCKSEPLHPPCYCRCPPWRSSCSKRWNGDNRRCHPPCRQQGTDSSLEVPVDTNQHIYTQEQPSKRPVYRHCLQHGWRRHHCQAERCPSAAASKRLQPSDCWQLVDVDCCSTSSKTFCSYSKRNPNSLPGRTWIGYRKERAAVQFVLDSIFILTFEDMKESRGRYSLCPGFTGKWIEHSDGDALNFLCESGTDLTDYVT